MWLIKASLRNPYMVATIVFMLIVLGALSISRISVDILPAFKAPAVQVITYYQGMPASSIEKTISNRIERWVNQAPGASLVESKSIPGVSVVRVYFRDDTDATAALTMTNQLALGTMPTLPPNTLPPVVLPFDPTATMPLGVLTVENPNLDEANVKDVARIQMRMFLGSVPGCIAPVVVGGKDRTVILYLDPKKLEARHLSMLDVVTALKDGNMMVTPGVAYFGENQLLLDTNMMVESVQDLNDLPIRTDPNNNVYLRDIGHAEDSFAIQTSRVRINGHRQVYIPIYRQQGASSLDVVNGVKNHLKYIQDRCPPGTELKFVMDQSIFVKEAIQSLIEEGAVGAVLVSVMILIFLGSWRMTLIASISIPLAILGAIIGLYVTGNTINAMTLGGLALAIGPLVDDAIVELENNHRNYSLGKTRIRAALDGCAEVMVPVLVATCTTNIVLAPMAMMPGMGGFLFRPLALAVTFAMVSSFFLSRTFVPMMCAKFLPDYHRTSREKRHEDSKTTAGMDEHGSHGEPTTFFERIHHRIERLIDATNRSYTRQLEFTLRHRFKLLGFVGLLILVAMFLSVRIGREFFPQVDAGQITMFLRCPSNLRLDGSEKRLEKVEELIRQNIPKDELDMIVAEMGVDPDWSAAYTANSGEQDSVVRIQLTEKRKLSSQEYASKLRNAIENDPVLADLRVSFNTGGMISTALNNGASSPLDIQIEGGKREVASKIALEVRNRVRGIAGVADTRVLQRLDAPYLMIDVDRPKAAAAGLSPKEVIEQTIAALNSSVSINRNFWIDVKSGNQYFVGVQYPENPAMKFEDLLNIEATGVKQSTPVKLSTLAKFRKVSGAVEINHVSLMPVFNIQVNTEGRDIASVATDVEKAIADVRGNLPEGMFITFKGEFERMNESAWNLLQGLGLAIVLVYLLQVALFRSWLSPFIIMFTVPLGLIGVVFILYLTNTTLNVQSEMGAIFLVGIEVNTGVLIVEFANKQRKLGLSPRDAVVKAATLRFRPIIMTFLACFIDLLPMAIGMGGRGSEANIPLARAVVGGLLCSTLLSRFVLPVLYTLLVRDKKVEDVDIEAELADEPVQVPVIGSGIIGERHQELLVETSPSKGSIRLEDA